MFAGNHIKRRQTFMHIGNNQKSYLEIGSNMPKIFLCLWNPQITWTDADFSRKDEPIIDVGMAGNLR